MQTLLKNILDSLEDTHLWDLAQRITSEQELLHLGLKVLRLDGYKVASALNNKKHIQLAALEVLNSWIANQTNREEAYGNLYRALGDHGWSLLQDELRKRVLNSTSSRPPLSDALRTSKPRAASQTAAPVTANLPIVQPSTSTSTTIQIESTTESKPVYFDLKMCIEQTLSL